MKQEESILFQRIAPAGIILFARNIANPAQLAALITALRAVLPEQAVLMLDQEGGRVARLRPPHWRAHPPAGAIGALHARDPEAGRRAAWLSGALIGAECRAAGFDVVCAPVLDRRLPGMHDIVGDRAYADHAAAVAALGGAMADGLLAAGIQPVGKHAPGHGRARCDSHLALPRVAEGAEADLEPFARLAPRLPWMMSAHILYEQWDAGRPGTLSPTVLGLVVRGAIGFDGVLVSDDLAMKALHGEPGALAAQAVAAGCDLALYCPGDPEGNASVLRAAPPIGPTTLARMARGAALARARRTALDPGALAAERDALLGRAA